MLTLCGNQVDELVAVLTDDDRAEVARHIVPLDTISVLVVEDSEAGLVVELLQSLNGDPNVVLSFDGSLLDALMVVRLVDARLSCG